MRGKVAKKVAQANALASFTAQEANRLLDEGRLVAIEDPKNSYLWAMPEFVALA